MSKQSVPKEFLGAFKRGHRRASREFIDEDFSRLLLRKVEGGCEESRKALVWLTRFNNEYHKNVIKRGDETALHSTPELRRDCYRREYARQNDVYTHYKVSLERNSHVYELRTPKDETEVE